MNNLRPIIRTGLALLASLVACSSGFAQTPPDLAQIRLPEGFSIEVWADDVPNARSLAIGDLGTVFVGTRSDGRVFAIRAGEDGRQEVLTIAQHLIMPNGVAFHDGSLYVAEVGRIIRFPDIEVSLPAIPEPEVVADDLPTERHHGWRYIDFGPDGKLYISIGGPCNVCDREGYALIMRMDPDGSNRETIAAGVRNSVGFAWQPGSGDLWFTDNGRDMLGDDLPPGELNRVTQQGQHFGFPFCHGDDIADPEFGEQRACTEFEPPAQKLGPHVAPLGIHFYTGDNFPAQYRNHVFIAEHGSWNRSTKIGYRIMMVRIVDGRAAGYEEFAAGWLQGDSVSGRPVDLLELDDGSMLVSDDHAGVIYRISYSRPLNDGVS